MKIPFKIGDLIQPLYLATYSSRLSGRNPLNIDYKNKIFKILEISGPHKLTYTNSYYSIAAVCLENGLVYGFSYSDENDYKIIKRNINYKIKIKTK
jgi:hypothetical protein